MQGFNRYYPPDYDPKKHRTLNDYHGKHALGDRARKIDQGILITRFELPFNIWCGTCNAHIGMGVRYNAEKRKVGMYYTTPIFAFRCKCHLCSGWFEIQTDPKNTRYVVTSGARQKDEEWNPEEAGGYAIHENDPSKAGPIDPLAQVEKTAESSRYAREVGAPRIESLQELSETYNADPYELSKRVRKQFREDKKIEKRKREDDDSFKDKYALPSTLKLVDEADIREEASTKWAQERGEWEVLERSKRRRTMAEMGRAPKQDGTLATSLLSGALKRQDPFSALEASL
ncbi:Coiled-coil domain-containing protein 130 AltName: Full=9 kDa protein [Serendipita indica DSM 11827]|nr:Coiled-coil domain-containing protein 130 AltName: Full=9 kDa protein [Serendipita indica DSM 11827]